MLDQDSIVKLSCAFPAFQTVMFEVRPSVDLVGHLRRDFMLGNVLKDVSYFPE